MTCRDYLAQHSDYLDERLDAAAAERVRAHAAECADCARYDRVVRRGLRLVRELPDVVPSSDFQQRLQHRLFHVQEELAHERFAASGAAAALAIAGVIAFAAWSPLMRPVTADGPATLATVEAAPAPARGQQPDAAQQSIRTPAWWFAPGMPGVFSHSSAGGYAGLGATLDPAVAFPGPYSPLIVSPPRRLSASTAILARYSE